MLTYEEIKNNETIRTYISMADESLHALGFTEHSFAHVTRVAEVSDYILTTLGYPPHDIEIIKIAAYMHDIGNLVNRVDHSQSGAVMAFKLLTDLGMPAADIASVVTAIGNHDEGTGVPVTAPAAALLPLDEGGFLPAGESCATSLPGIFVAGDCRTKEIRQLTTACADGSAAALAAIEYLSR